MPKPGAYREPLILGLKELGHDEVARQVEAGNVKIAVASSIFGPVTRRDDLTPLYVDALAEARVYADGLSGIVDHYVSGLTQGKLVPVVAVGVDVIYTDGRTTPTPGPEKEWTPGELFLKS